MEFASLLARLALAGVFAAAGATKLMDGAGFRQTLRDFGVPAALLTPVAFLLPVVELGVALALLSATTAWWATLLALTLLLLFSAVIGYSLARGRRPSCRCFGQLSAAPVSGGTLLRNALLAAAAGHLAWQGPGGLGPGLLEWLADMAPFEGALLLVGAAAAAVLGVEGWLVLSLLRQNGRLLLRVEALEAQVGVGVSQSAARARHSLAVGAAAPDFLLAGLDGRMHSLGALRGQGRPVMLVFSDPGCGPCDALLPQLAELERARGAELAIALVSRGSPELNSAKAAEHGLGTVLLQHDREVALAYGAQATPTAVLVRPDGTIGSGLAPGARAIIALAEETARRVAAELAPA